MLAELKHIIDLFSAPTISFTFLTILFLFLFPPTDWFDKVNRKLYIYKIWTNTGGAVLFVILTTFFAIRL